MSEPQKYSDRIYRSGSAIAAGVLLLALGGWLGIDAMVRGDGRTPVTAIAGLLLAVPLVVAFTFRPAVFASDDLLRVRNPFRTVTLPWGEVETVRAGYSSEVLTTGGAKYQLWAIPVSLRARSRAQRRSARDGESGGRTPRGGRLGGFGGFGGPDSEHGAPQFGPSKGAQADQTVLELRELAERRHEKPEAQGTVTVRWSWETMAPAAVGLVALLVLWLTN
ncbi:PH domain-containing protein [Streptomyces sp. RFCAC02]|uniref:PH domain-containing protein n=1 Tax=Streptomyces sp. RFCAC02 TaxID=2499143 RepID=UPI00101FD666|nr:PH domain-containing protein [Streptomyces sp. RFCAC02]